MAPDERLPSFEDVEAAAARLRAHLRPTPVLRSRTLDEVLGARVHLKAEHLQRGGAFKARGAHNAVWSLTDDEVARGVATHSSGNHAVALAAAARSRGAVCHVVVPEGAPAAKLAAARAYGALVERCGPTLADREAGLDDVVRRTGAVVVHPYDDVRVIAGAATVALELLERVGDLDAIVVPVGGGGLLAGTVVTTAAVAPHVQVYAAEPAGADDAARSFAAGRLIPQTAPDTVADGLRTSLAPRTFRALRAAAGVVTVDDDTILAALELVWQRTKQLVEPSAAVGVAALLDGDLLQGRNVGVVLTGGNVDPRDVPRRRGVPPT